MTEFSTLTMIGILFGRLFRLHKPFRYQEDYDNAVINFRNRTFFSNQRWEQHLKGVYNCNDNLGECNRLIHHTIERWRHVESSPAKKLMIGLVTRSDLPRKSVNDGRHKIRLQIGQYGIPVQYQIKSLNVECRIWSQDPTRYLKQVDSLTQKWVTIS